MSVPRTVERYIGSHGVRKKRRRIIYVCLIFFVVFLVLLGALWVFMRSGFFAVREIRVEGAGAISDAEIVQDASTAVSSHGWWRHFLGPHNMLMWPSVFTSDDLQLTPRLVGMTVTKDYWNGTIDIAVDMRTPKGIWCSAQGGALVGMADASSTITRSFTCFAFDQSGFVFEDAPHAEGGLVHVVDDYTGRKIGVRSSILPQNLVPPLFSIFGVLEQGALGVKEVRLEDLAFQEVRVVTYNGPTLLFSLRFDADDALPVLLSLQWRPGFHNLAYVDFRTQGRVYYR